MKREEIDIKSSIIYNYSNIFLRCSDGITKSMLKFIISLRTSAELKKRNISNN